MALQSFYEIRPEDVVGMGLTPERTNYLDTYDFTTNDRPDVRIQAIEKYDNTLAGFMKKFSNVETLNSDKYIWTELEKRAVTYDDAVLTVGTDNVLTRADSAPLHYRLHEKVQLHTDDGPGVFIVTDVTSATSIKLGTYDADSVAVVSGYSAALEGTLAYSLGIEVQKGSKGEDFTAGRRIPYSIHSNRPAITRDVYTEVGSTPPQIKWVMINGTPKWFLEEIDATRENFLEAVEKKHVEGDFPDSSSDAYSAGLQGTQGVFAAIRDRGGRWDGQIETEADLESLIKHYDVVQGSGQNLYLCTRDQEFKFDALGKQYNASYGDAAPMKYIGEYPNADPEKILDLSFYGFHYGGYTFKKQGWKYLNEATFRGNSNIAAADKMNFLAVPLGMTPVAPGEQDLAHNPRTVMQNYLTIMATEGRDYDTWTTGGAWVQPRTDGDDSFKVHFLNESLAAVHAAEKFVIGEGTA